MVRYFWITDANSKDIIETPSGIKIHSNFIDAFAHYAVQKGYQSVQELSENLTEYFYCHVIDIEEKQSPEITTIRKFSISYNVAYEIIDLIGELGKKLGTLEQKIQEELKRAAKSNH